MVDLLLRITVRRLLEAPVPLRLTEDLAPLLASGGRSLDSRHLALTSLSQHLAQGPRVGFGDGRVLAKAPLPLRRLLGQVVALHCTAAQQFAARADLKPLLGAARCFRFRHLPSSFPRSSSGPAPSPCCGRRGAAAIRSGRSP